MKFRADSKVWMEEEDDATCITIEAASEFIKFIIEKGSVPADGTSLTAAFSDFEVLKVSIISITGAETAILSKKPDEEVNMEYDIEITAFNFDQKQ